MKIKIWKINIADNKGVQSSGSTQILRGQPRIISEMGNLASLGDMGPNKKDQAQRILKY